MTEYCGMTVAGATAGRKGPAAEEQGPMSDMDMTCTILYV